MDLRAAGQAVTETTMGKGNDDAASSPDSALPAGYRQGLITAIALFLSLSIAFLRFWSFEAPGSWTPASMAATLFTAAGMVLQLVALFRALDVRDEALRRYRATVRTFLVSVVIVLIGATMSSIVLAIEGG